MTKRIRALFNMPDNFLLISDINKKIYGMEEIMGIDAVFEN